MSEEAAVYAAAEPKSSIETALGAAATPKGEPQISVKFYFHYDGTEGSVLAAERHVQASFERMRAWAAASRVAQ